MRLMGDDSQQSDQQSNWAGSCHFAPVMGAKLRVIDSVGIVSQTTWSFASNSCELCFSHWHTVCTKTPPKHHHQQQQQHHHHHPPCHRHRPHCHPPPPHRLPKFRRSVTILLLEQLHTIALITVLSSAKKNGMQPIHPVESVMLASSTEATSCPDL